MYGGIDLLFLFQSTGGGGGMAPPSPFVSPLSYASEQHATEDLMKKGIREKSTHAHHVRLCTAMQKPPILRWAKRMDAMPPTRP